MEISKKAQDWLLFGEHGASSEAIFTKLTGMPFNNSHPSDPSDFRRCMLLLKQVPELKSHLNEMAKVSPAWDALVEHWDEIASLLKKEVPDWAERYASGRASETYKLMLKIIDGVNQKEN